MYGKIGYGSGRRTIDGPEPGIPDMAIRRRFVGGRVRKFAVMKCQLMHIFVSPLIS